MRRRDFITLLGGTAAAWPLAARAQQPAMPVIGLLSSGGPNGPVEYNAAFRRGLGEAGYVEGRNITIEYRWAEFHYDRLPALATDLVRRQVAVIATNGGSGPPLAARSATATIPIVFVMGADPIKLGLGESLNRPGGNITGISVLNVELGPKRLQLLHELVPVKNIALLVNPNDPNAAIQLRDLQGASRALGLEIQVLYASAEPDFEKIFATLAERQISALIIGADPFLTGHLTQLAALAARYAIPAIALYREFAAAGGLASYGPSVDARRYAGSYVGRILKGEKPADLPIIQSATFELVVNLKSARALGVNVPLSLLASADEVIE
jgi:putative tryptophan/tyrosine transport system substrate-binding protein